MFNAFFQCVEKLNTKQQSAAAHKLLKEKLAQKYGVFESEIEIFKDEKGCPFVRFRQNVFISLSHTNGMVACAFADSRVGIDAEKLAKRRKSVEKRVFTANEINLLESCEDEDLAFFTLWTLKEAYLKAIGTGFAGNAKEIEFTCLWPQVKSNRPQFLFDTQFYGGYIVSTCVESSNS